MLRFITSIFLRRLLICKSQPRFRKSFDECTETLMNSIVTQAFTLEEFSEHMKVLY